MRNRRNPRPLAAGRRLTVRPDVAPLVRRSRPARAPVDGPGATPGDRYAPETSTRLPGRSAIVLRRNGAVAFR